MSRARGSPGNGGAGAAAATARPLTRRRKWRERARRERARAAPEEPLPLAGGKEMPEGVRSRLGVGKGLWGRPVQPVADRHLVIQTMELSLSFNTSRGALFQPGDEERGAAEQTAPARKLLEGTCGRQRQEFRGRRRAVGVNSQTQPDPTVVPGSGSATPSRGLWMLLAWAALALGARTKPPLVPACWNGCRGCSGFSDKDPWSGTAQTLPAGPRSCSILPSHP
ncbi:uncharacterized protein LOC119712433 [Motacilla alba alba]|uniref:uncharacterized protein LOC119712433 n=1 Tax=Motacilla alba alba TaxID=1094192 RepID=UPI0018D5A3E7|nr:uncharacterized protein LOC119712433 [Motacilla alba alba]